MKKRDMNGKTSMKEAIETSANFDTVYDDKAPPMKLKNYIQLEQLFDQHIEFVDGRFQYRVEPVKDGKEKA